VWPFGERFLYIPSVGLAGLAAALLPTAKVLWVPLLAACAGLAAWHATHFRSTLGLVESSLRWFPGSASLWMIRGEEALQGSLKDAEKGAPAAGRLAGARAAIADLERALLIRPGWYRARRTLAQALASAEETTRSEALFRELLAENHRDPLPPSNLAVLLLQSGRRKEARELLLEALRRQPDFGPAKTNLEWLDAGR
jgi:tetratricopeptide (TPR) repeat protein